MLKRIFGTLAITAAAVAFSVASAQATPVPLYTGTSAHCTTTGDNGVAGGVFSSYHCQLGIAGYTLFAEGTPGSTGANVHLNTFSTNALCAQAGGNGVSGGLFSSYHCQSGIAGYSLNVVD